MIMPGWPCVRLLNCLQNSMMLTPCGPRAVPTGGAGFAAPAGTCSLTKAVTFLLPPFPAGLAPGFCGGAIDASWRRRSTGSHDELRGRANVCVFGGLSAQHFDYLTA